MRPAALALLPLLLAGCTDDPAPKPAPSPPPAVNRLAELARKAADGAYDATYRFVADGAESGTLRIRQIPPDYRLDITLGPTTASYFALTSGVVACTKKPKVPWDCFLVARPGEEVPELFDPGVQDLFRGAVAELAANPDDYDVTPIPVPSPSGFVSPSPTATLPPSECFDVVRREPASPDPSGEVPTGFEDGTYCFAADGVPTRFAVKTGVISLVLLGAEPVGTDFDPPAKPKTLPSLSPSPSPSRSR